ncbi:hypothetical protein EV137_0422 [Kribbella pratensis]|uniref:Ribosomally synthesized peptide with SipW-like signal peptide n=1 Tax=Kribbella pratensis TaxID=2512112 RepID=A0ABY2FJ49_9ACTN|nr:hypothetical protein [Kribbella pratensis]TDW93150.1 hypothetical protein EV137_0422 [Kribbella pratensis]
MKRRARRTAVLVLSTLAAVAAVTADAYWPGSADGTAAGTAGGALSITMTAGTPTTQLSPGGSAGVALTISNPNLFGVRITALSLNTGAGTGGFAVDAAHAGCAVATLSYTQQTNGGAGWTVPAKLGAVNGSLPLDLPAALTMNVDAANACQGASFTVFLLAG